MIIRPHVVSDTGGNLLPMALVCMEIVHRC
jgi:hypothetical protein